MKGKVFEGVDGGTGEGRWVLCVRLYVLCVCDCVVIDLHIIIVLLTLLLYIFFNPYFLFCHILSLVLCFH